MTSQSLRRASLRATPLLLLAIVAWARPIPGCGRTGTRGPRRPASCPRASTASAADLYQKTDQAENLVFSPSSLSTVMALVYAGARQETAEEIGAALHFPVPPDQLHLAFACAAARAEEDL